MQFLRQMRVQLLLFLLFALSACGTKGVVSIENSSKSSLSGLTQLGGNSESFDTSDSFTKETTKPGFLYVSCQKKTKSDLSTINAKVQVGDIVKGTGTTSQEYGIASASGSW